MENKNEVNNKYYDLFISEEVDDSILDAKISNTEFEDHFWHLAALSVYYKKQKDDYLEKMVLRKLCDLNYAYSALYYFDKLDVLPNKFKIYMTPFVNQMKDDKIEERIKFFNKQDKKKQTKSFMLYSASTLIVVPLMLLLVFGFKVDTTVAMVISIAVLFVMQFMMNPIIKQRKAMKEYGRPIERRLENYLKYYDRFVPLFQNDLYMDLIRNKDEKKQEEIIKKIKAGDNKNV